MEKPTGRWGRSGAEGGEGGHGTNINQLEKQVGGQASRPEGQACFSRMNGLGRSWVREEEF